MKTFNCWLIANILPYAVIISFFLSMPGLESRINSFSFWDYFVVFGCGGIFSIIVMIYTYCNIDEILSCRFIWGNSNVSIFSFSLIYTFRKGVLAFLLPGAIYFSILSFTIIKNESDEPRKVTEQIKINSDLSASKTKEIKDKEIIMVCEHIKDGDYYLYHPEQCVSQNEKNPVYLSENGIRIKAFTNEGESMDTHYQNEIKNKDEQGWNTTYKHRSKTKYFLSGKKSNGIIYYQKTVKSDSGKYYTICIEYPESETNFGNQYIEHYIKHFPEQI
jgi:hypothetical protein